MASSKIKGITIEIGGDTTKLGKAIADTEKQTRSLQGELKQINSLLKFDPKNTELLTQKQAVLSQTVEETKSKLDILKEAEKQVIEQFQRGEVAEDQVRALQREIIKTESSLQATREELNDTNKALESVANSAGDFADAQRDTRSQTEKLEDSISDQENTLKDLKERYANAVLEQGKYSSGAKELAREIDSLSEELADNKKRLENARDSADLLDHSLDDLDESARKAGDGFSVMNVAIGNMISDGIERATEAVADFAKESITTGMDFESAMAEVQAISGATGDDLALLEETAKKYGATTVFSASESAQALKYMSLAGWSAKQSSEALGGVLNLASASGMDLAQASDMVTDYLSAFGMEAKKSTYFADMLAFAQANSNTSVEQLSEAYRNCGATLNASGQDVETVTALLAQMANQGFKGSEAGTALTAIMRDMTAKMKDGAIKIGDTSIAVMDANGNYRDMTDILKEVEKATNGMGDAERATALSTTFTADSTKGLNLLLNAGVGSAEDFEKALREAGGTAEKMGDIMNDNANGDLKQMESALEDLQISLYDELQPTIRDIIQIVTNDVIPVVKEDVIPAVRDFINFILNNGDTIISLIAGIGAGFIAWNVGSMIMGVVGAIKAYKLANEGATISQMIFNGVLKANPIIFIVSLITTLVAGIITFIATNDEARAKFIEIWNKIKEVAGAVLEAIVGFFSSAWETIKAIWSVVVEFFSGLWENIKLVFSTVGEFFAGIWETVKAIFAPVIDFFVGIFTEIWKTLESIITVIVGLVKGCWEIICRIFEVAFEWFNNTVLEPIKNAFSIVWTAISSFASACWEGIKAVFMPVINWFNDTIITPLATFFSGMWDKLKKGASDAWEGIKSVFTGITNWFKDKFTQAWTAVKNVFSTGGKIFTGIKEGIANVFKTVVNAIIRGINKVIAIPFDAINGMLNGIRNASFLGISPFKSLWSENPLYTPQIPELARGGILKKGQVGLLEGDGAEAVVPLEKNTEWIRNVARQMNDFQDQQRASVNSALLGRLNDIYNRLDNLNQSIVLDTGVLVGETINQIDSGLATNYAMRARGI